MIRTPSLAEEIAELRELLFGRYFAGLRQLNDVEPEEPALPG